MTRIAPQRADFSTPTPTSTPDLRIDGTPGSLWRPDLGSWAIQNNGGSINLEVNLPSPAPVLLTFTLCSGVVDWKTNCPVSIAVNDKELVNGFDPHDVNFYEKRVDVPSSVLQSGWNKIRLVLEPQASTVVFVKRIDVTSIVARKNAAKLTSTEQHRYVDAVTELNADPANTYGNLVAIHGDMRHMMHGFMGPVGAARFLPWHRAYLQAFEQALQVIDADAFVPYWDWTTSRAVPDWLEKVTPTVRIPGIAAPLTVTRNPAPASQLPTASQIEALVAADRTFTDFENILEGYHNGVHTWFRGTMSNVPTAPADPVFWLHHAQVDRLWSLWQARYPGRDPALTGANAVMDPWTSTETSLRLIDALGYFYE